MPWLRARWASRSNSRVASATGSPRARTSRRAISTSIVVADVHDVVVVAGLGLATAQDRLHPGDDLAGRERLGDVVVGAQLEAEDAIDLAVAGGEEQHRHACCVARIRRHTSKPSMSGRPMSSTHERRPVLVDQLQPALAAGRLQHAEAGLAQVQVEQVGDVRVVLDDHDAFVSVIGVAATVPMVARWYRAGGHRGRARCDAGGGG